MTSAAPPTVSPGRFVSTGLAALDAIVGGLRVGDNVVWRVDGLDDYRTFIAPFVASARSDGRRVVHLRFASHAPVVDESAVDAVYALDALRGFEPFTLRVHEIAALEGPGVFYVVDCLSDLLDAWATDAMIASFFRVTCPYLFELDTVAWFAIERGAHSFATVDGIRATTQLLIDVYDDNGVRYVHPLKVWQRSSPTMFLPHRHADGAFTPITVSAEATRLFERLSRRGKEGRALDAWEALFLRAAALTDARAGAAERDAMVAQLCRLVISRDERILALARRHFTLDDLLAVKERLIGTGCIGGKAAGMLIARAILRADRDGGWDGVLEPHDSYYIGSDLFHSYIVDNGWWRLFVSQRSEAGYFRDAAALRERILHGKLPPDVERAFREMLEHFGQYPIIIRSSSLLEDGFGNAFAGKYDSIFCVNQGSPDERLAQFADAVRAVYASTLSEEALRYRMQRGLASREEQMALLVQRVSGAYHGDLFFPACAGVGVSYNTFVWRHDIDPAAGMLRMVVGLGTRAVDRVEGDYPRIASLDKPLLVPQADAADRRRYTQRDADVLDVARNRLRTVPLSSLRADPATLPMERFADRDGAGWVVSFERFLGRDGFAGTMSRLLGTLARAYEYPVDVEFAVTFATDGRPWLNLIQCRPLQTRGVQSSRVAIGEASDADTLFRSTGSFMGGSIVAPIGRVIRVDPAAYVALPLSDKYEVARLVGRLNRGIVARDQVPTLLMGPGRWGTSTPQLGVPVRFAEIDAVTAIAEVAFAAGGLQPELSFGTHFFQDLVETGIFYVALDPERDGCVVNPALVGTWENELESLLPDDARLSGVVRVVTPKDSLTLLADVVSQKVLCCRAVQGGAPGAAALRASTEAGAQRSR